MGTQRGDINWKAFADYMSKNFKWFEESASKFFGDNIYNGIDTRRIDHILSGKEISDERIVLKIQDNDPFADGIESYIVFMNSAIRKKYDYYFIIEKVDYF